MGSIKKGSKTLTVPIKHNGKTIEHIIRSYDAKVISFTYPWMNLVPRTAISNNGGPMGGTLWMRGFVFNDRGDGRVHTSTFDTMPFQYRYERHTTHAISENMIIAERILGESIKTNELHLTIAAVTLSNQFTGEISVDINDHTKGGALGQFKIWHDDAASKYKITLETTYMYDRVNDVTQRHGWVRRKDDVFVDVHHARTHDLNSNWVRLSKIYYNIQNGSWAELYIRMVPVSGAPAGTFNIELAEKCDWQGKRTEYGVFAVTKWQSQGKPKPVVFTKK